MENKKNNKVLKNFIFIFAGVLLLAGLVFATTSISDTGIVTTGNVTIGGIINAQAYAGQLMRVNDSVFETAVTGTEYFSSNQNGGIYGTIYRQYFTTTLTTTNPRLDTGNSVTGLIDYAIQFTYGADPRGLAHGNAAQFGSGSNRMYIQLSGASGGGNLSIDNLSYTAYAGWIDYTR